MYAKLIQKTSCSKQRKNNGAFFPLHMELYPIPQFRAVGQNCTFSVILISSHKLSIPTV